MKQFNLLNRFSFCFVVISVILFFYGCADGKDKSKSKKGGEQMAFELTSTAFKNGEYIPKKYTGEGIDISPPLKWLNPPQNTKSFALICDDPDAPVGTWVHWVIFNIPAGSNILQEAFPTTPDVSNGTRQGVNDFGNIGYSGPMPPKGPSHRYFFKLYALDTTVELDPGTTKKQLLKKMEGHILTEAQLMGLYKK